MIRRYTRNIQGNTYIITDTIIKCAHCEQTTKSGIYWELYSKKKSYQILSCLSCKKEVEKIASTFEGHSNTLIHNVPYRKGDIPVVNSNAIQLVSGKYRDVWEAAINTTDGAAVIDKTEYSGRVGYTLEGNDTPQIGKSVEELDEEYVDVGVDDILLAKPIIPKQLNDKNN